MNNKTIIENALGRFHSIFLPLGTFDAKLLVVGNAWNRLLVFDEIDLKLEEFMLQSPSQFANTSYVKMVKIIPEKQDERRVLDIFTRNSVYRVKILQDKTWNYLWKHADKDGVIWDMSEYEIQCVEDMLQGVGTNGDII